jgi:transposase-like protein
MMIELVDDIDESPLDDETEDVFKTREISNDRSLRTKENHARRYKTRRDKHTSDSLNSKHYQAIDLILAGGKTGRDIAKEIGVNYATFWRWKQSIAFREELQKKREEQHESYYNREVNYAEEAQKTLYMFMQNAEIKDSIRLRAAQILVGRTPSTKDKQVTAPPVPPKSLVAQLTDREIQAADPSKLIDLLKQ